MKNLDRNYWYCRDEESLGKIMRLKVSDHFYEDENVIDTAIIASASKSPINPWNFTEKCRQPEIEILEISADEMSQSKKHKWKIPMDKRRRYSSGDYLRQQILNDLNSPEILDKSDEALAFDRYNRVRNYLNSVEAIRLHPSDDNDSDIPCDRRRSRRIRRRYSDNRSDCGYHRQRRRVRGDLERSFDKCDCGRRIDRRTRSDVTPRRRNFTGKSRGKFGENLARSASCPAREWARKPRIYQGFLESGESDGDEGAEDDRDNAGLSTETETILQENYLVVEPLISHLQGIQVNAHVPNEFDSMDIGYDSITKGLAKIWMEFQENSRVKKSKTFRIVNGSDENATFYCCNSVDWTDENHVNESLGTMDGSITGDYFRRVYDLLKQRQVDGDRRRNDKSFDPSGYYDDTSSSNFSQESGKKRRRRKKRNTSKGEEVVVSSVLGGQEAGWHHQINNNNNNNDEVEEEVDRSNYLSFCRPQLRDLSDNKRRPPPPPIPAKYKINPRDISKYFNYPNKENSPDYVVNNENTILTNEEKEMGSNLSRHSGKGLNGRRTQSSGNLCDPKGKLNHVGKILVPCSSGPQERYKISGSLPNNLDDKDSLGDDPIDNNNVISDTISGNLGGTLPHKKRSHGVHFSDSPVGALDLVRYRSQDSLEGNPWRYQTDNDLDLVRCKHGNFDLVRKNQSVDTVDTGVKYSRVYDDKYQQNHLDLVGTLPKRRIDPKWCDPSSIQAFQQQSAIDTVDGDLLMKVVHKPECELMKHRKYERLSDAKTSRIEHQDQGYASERSPEDEHPPSLPGKHLLHINPENTFRVTLQKCSRGLGLSVSGGGNAGPVRVKRLFPQQPAALSNKLQSGDILLAANGIPLTGLTNYEALEVLRTTWNTVELLVCRLPGEEQNISPPGVPPPPPARRELPPALRLLNPLPPLQIEPCGEFDIEMTKVAGSLGFTLRKVDSSALGHYVRALVREPALSDGRIQPGDKIVAVDGAPLSPMSHEEAVALLRQCGPRVKLRLYRDLAQTPVSALSPTEPDHPLRPPRTSLRQEAMDMLCDLAVRKLSPGTSNGSSQNTSGTSANSPRRLRRPASRTPTGERENEPIYSTNQISTASQVDTSDSDQCSIKTQVTNSAAATPDDIIDPPALYDICDSIDPNKPSRPSFLNLIGPIEKPNYQFSLESECEETIIIPENDKKSIDYIENFNRDLANELQDNTLPSEPASMPPLISVIRTNSGAFSYKNPAYQSANPTCGSGENGSGKNKNSHSSDQDIPGKVLSVDDPGGTKGLLKWKGVMFAPDDEEGKDMPEANARAKKREESLQREGYDVFMVELTRGWNSRLGFSLRPDGNDTVISMVHSDSVAAKDGRLKQGDVLIMVNDENVEIMPTEEIIDLLRKIRGSIGITVARKKSDET